MDPQFKLVTYTALAIVAQQGIGPLQQIRQKNDPAYNRWPPHINLFFPFVQPQSFNTIYDTLVQAFKDFQQFQITFTQFDSFPHGTIFLNPDVNGKKIHQAYEIIAGKYPEFKDKKHKQFNPHMTAAKVKKFEIENKKTQFQADWQQWKIKCKGLHMIAREKNSPFQIIKFVPFKKEEQ